MCGVRKVNSFVPLANPLYTSPWTEALLLVQTQLHELGLHSLVVTLHALPGPAAQDVLTQHAPSCCASSRTYLCALSLQIGTSCLPCFKNSTASCITTALLTSSLARWWLLHVTTRTRDVTVEEYIVISTANTCQLLGSCHAVELHVTLGIYSKQHVFQGYHAFLGNMDIIGAALRQAV